MSKDFAFSTAASTAMTETIQLDTDVTGVSLTIEFSDREDFATVRLSKTVTGSGQTATLTLSAADVESLHGGFHRVKNGSTVLATGRLYYSPTASGLTNAQIQDPVLRSALGRSTTGFFVPGGWGANWRAKLATANSQLVKVAVVGDSLSQGYYTSAPLTKSWPALLAARLQALYGDGGSGFVGASLTTYFANSKSIAAPTQTAYSGNNTYWATSGTWSLYTGGNYGPGAHEIQSTQVGATVTITGLRGTTIKLYTLSNGGSNAAWKYSVDGATQVNVSDAAASVQVTTITGLSSGTHSVVITQAGTGSNTLLVIGAAAYNATGVVIDNYSVYGATSALLNAARPAATTNPGVWSGGSLNPCDLYIYELGANDAAVTVASGVTLGAAAATFATSLTTSAYLPPGPYRIDSENVIVSNSTSTTATLLYPLSASHSSGAVVNQVQSTPEAWTKNAAINIIDARSVTNNPDVLIIMPHIGTYDTVNGFPAIAQRARGLAEQFGAALVDVWAIGRNSWNYFNNLGYFGTSGNPGVAGTDAAHPSDAGSVFYELQIGPLVVSG